MPKLVPKYKIMVENEDFNCSFKLSEIFYSLKDGILKKRIMYRAFTHNPRCSLNQI